MARIDDPPPAYDLAVLQRMTSIARHGRRLLGELARFWHLRSGARRTLPDHIAHPCKSLASIANDEYLSIPIGARIQKRALGG